MTGRTQDTHGTVTGHKDLKSEIRIQKIVPVNIMCPNFSGSSVFTIVRACVPL
jgi:hypothetical protein